MSYEQGELFGIEADIDPMSIFPRFEIRQPGEVFSRRPKLPEMPDILRKLGFKVGEMRHHVGTVLVFPTGPAEDQESVFEASYPPGWKLTDNLSGSIYTGDYNPVRQILDAKGNLRGIAHCADDLLPISAQLYTKYSVWSQVPLNFAKVTFDRSDVKSVVVDTTKIDPLYPNKLDVVEYIDTRWLLAEKYPELRNIPMNERLAWCDANIAEDDRFSLVDVNGSTLWLDEHFPDWRDPAAYWPN